MGKLYESYEKLKLDDNLVNNAQLIYTLAAIQTKFDYKYSIERGNDFNQFWLYTRIKDSKGEHNVLLQATQYDNGKVQLSIQGLSFIENVNNFIDYSNPNEHNIFMEYLKYF